MSLKKNIIYLYFKGKHLITSKSQYQYNHGQYLYFADLNLPQAFEVHFSNKQRGESKTQIGSNKLVEIPDEYFWSGALEIYAWIYLHSGVDDGETIYEVKIPLIKRAKPTDEEPLPVQQSAIDKAIAELNNAVDITNENADKTNTDKTQVATIKEEIVTLKEEIDSTASAVSQDVQSARESANASEQSAQNSAESERKALDYSDEAKGYAQSALDSKNTVSQKAQVATDASAEAKDFRDKAETFKNEAEQAKNRAEELAGYRHIIFSNDSYFVSLKSTGATYKEEKAGAEVIAYKGDERLKITDISGFPTIKYKRPMSTTLPVNTTTDEQYGITSFYWDIKKSMSILTETITSALTITTEDSDGNIYIFNKNWTFGVIKDGVDGADGINGIALVFGTEGIILYNDTDYRMKEDTIISIPFCVYDGTQKIVSDNIYKWTFESNLTKVYINPETGIKEQVIGMVATIRKDSNWVYADYLIDKDWQLLNPTGNIPITVEYNNVEYTKSIPYSVILDGKDGNTGNGIETTVLNSDYTLTITFTDGTSYTTPSIRGEKGSKGDVGNGISSAILNNDYTLTLTFTNGTTYTTPSIRGEKGDKGDKIHIGDDGSIYME